MAESKAESKATHETIERAKELLQLLALEPIELDLFRGNNETHGPPRLFGGQVLAQGLRAACMTVPDDREPHSLHGYFCLLYTSDAADE